MKRLIANIVGDQELTFVIERDEKAGYYLIVYPTGSKKSLADYLFDSLDEALNAAKKNYGILPALWKEQE